MKVLAVQSRTLSDANIRLDASFHLSDGPIAKIKLKNSPFPLTTLGEVCDRIFSGNIFKRRYVKDENNGIPYITGSDMMKADIDGGKFISKKYTTQGANLRIGKGWILISCSGTLGNCVYTNEDFEDKIGTHDLIRAIPNDRTVKGGYLYAYLTSKHGHGLLTQSSYGGVVKHIEPHHLTNLPIPIFPDLKQIEIHTRIVDASNLRFEANKLIREAIDLLEKDLPEVNFPKIYTASIKSRTNHNLRLEASYNTSSIEAFYQEIAKRKITTRTIAELSKKVFTPGIFKRIRTDKPENGIPFLSGSDLLNQYPVFQNYLSRKMKNINNYILKEGWLAIQDAGTIGYISYITKFLDGVSATNNLVRIIPNENENFNFYIYCFFKTSVGQNLLKSLEYGSVQKHIDNHQVSKFKIPIIEAQFEAVSEKIKIAMTNFSQACFFEKEAVKILEKEIESWQK